MTAAVLLAIVVLAFSCWALLGGPARLRAWVTRRQFHHMRNVL